MADRLRMSVAALSGNNARPTGASPSVSTHGGIDWSHVARDMLAAQVEGYAREALAEDPGMLGRLLGNTPAGRGIRTQLDGTWTLPKACRWSPSPAIVIRRCR